MAWRVLVDVDVCRRSGLCSAMAPAELPAGDDDLPHPRHSAGNMVPGEVPTEVEDAVDCCPTGALTITTDARSDAS